MPTPCRTLPPPQRQRFAVAITTALLLALGTAACIEETAVVLPENTTSVRFRSVRVDASRCRVRGSPTGVDCADMTKPVADGLKVAGLRGVNGAPVASVDLDVAVDTFRANFGSVHAYWTRIPVGYGCGATLQGVFPDRKKPHVVGTTTETNIDAFNFKELNALIEATRGANTVPVWTAGYDIGEGDAACTYENGEQKGKAIADPLKYAQVVRQITRWYNRELPAKNSKEPRCNPEPGKSRPWDCTPSLFNIEFGRDPFGAGGFAADTKAKWLEAYKQFAIEMRNEFPLPSNGVSLIGPSVVIKGLLAVENPDPGNTSRSPIFDFIDYVVATQVPIKPADAKAGTTEEKGRLPLSYLAFEVEASTPSEAKAIVKKIADYAASKGLKHEKYMSKAAGKIEQRDDTGKIVGHLSDGSEPIPLWVTDLRFVPPTTKPLPDTLLKDPARLSAYVGAFFGATKILWQGLVSEASVATAPRLPTIDKAKSNIADVAKSSKDSPYFWFGTTGTKLPAPGSLKPAAWHSFWFNEGFLAEKQVLEVQHGPDALGGKLSSEDSGIVLLATRETCVDPLGKEIECIAADQTAKYPAVTAGRKRMLRVLVADLAVDASTGKEVLEHNLRIQIEKIPADVTTVGYRAAFMDGSSATWSQFIFSEPGTLIDAQNGVFHVTKTVSMPSLHYFEFLY